MSICLITGGAGFIGGHLARALLERGRRVRILDDLSTGQRKNIAEIEPDLELVIGDIRDADVVKRCMAGAEVVFHLAARASVPRSVEYPEQTNDVNINGNTQSAHRRSRRRHATLHLLGQQ